MAREDRVRLIKAIENRRKSKVITYITSDREGLKAGIGQDALPLIEQHLRELCGPKTKRLDLFIYSRGGDSNVPWNLVSMIREFLRKRPFAVLLPYRAHSAATVISLGADEIVMGPVGEMGPIDATIERGPHNPKDRQSNQPLPISVEDARGFFSFLEAVGLEDPSHKIQAFAQLAQNVHPLALGSVSRILSQTKQVTDQLLRARLNPLTEGENEAIVQQLSTGLTTHEHTIRRTEAKRLGLSFVKYAEDEKIDKEMWDLYKDYEVFFKFNEPFRPNDDLIVNNLDQKNWPALNIAMVESSHGKHVYSLDLSVRRLREVPPQVTLNLSNLQLALPQIPAGVDPAAQQQFINQFLMPIIQNQIDDAASRAVKALAQSLPQKGFEQVMTNAAWKLDQTPN